MNISEDQMSPREWLDYQRKIRGYSNEKISIERPREDYRKMGALTPGMERILSKHSMYSQADFEDRQIEILKIPLYAVLSKSERDKVTDVFIGMFPTYDINGYAGKTPRGDKIVMLHSGLFSSISQWATLFVFEIEYGLGNFIQSNYEAVLQHVASISRHWVRKSSLQHMKLATLNVKSAESLQDVGALAHGTAIFILGHELGHIIEGHHSYDVDNREYNYSMEFMADSWGLRLSIKYTLLLGLFYSRKIRFSQLMFLGPFLALGLIAAISNKDSILSPAASSRYNRIKETYKDTIESEMPNEEFYEAYKKCIGDNFVESTVHYGEYLFRKHEIYGRIIEKIASEL